MIIGITGGIGSGKSTIARALAARGYAVYDCDREAKRIIAENKDVQQQIIALLGPEAFVNGVYNTAYVAQRVFAEPELLERLNQIVHPAVKEDICQQALPAVLFIESAILYEAGLDSICDKIFVIEAPEDIRIARTIARDYHGDASPENIDKVRARIRAQHDQSTIKRPCRVTINQSTILLNDGRKSIDELVETIITLLS
jgi:dephospho-CoA kinase